MNESLRFLTELEKLRKAATNGGDWHLDESHCHGAINCGDKHIAMVSMYVCKDYPAQNVLRESNSLPTLSISLRRVSRSNFFPTHLYA